ncbi:ribonuclease HI family protein [Candidatus Hydrogenedentota bacterium]
MPQKVLLSLHTGSFKNGWLKKGESIEVTSNPPEGISGELWRVIAPWTLVFENGGTFPYGDNPNCAILHCQYPDAVSIMLTCVESEEKTKKTYKKPAAKHKNLERVILNTDGGSRGNPGPAGIGAVIKTPKGNVITEVSEYIGTATNNVAEYRALLAGLEKCAELGAEYVECRLDSQLIVHQMNGVYRVKDPRMKKHFAEVVELKNRFAACTFKHVRRNENSHADKLVNEALDAAEKDLCL